MQSKSNLSLRQLEYFKTISDIGSFRGAAARLGETQPTLTAQIATLEESLGVKLFERTRSGATPTVAARELMPVCHRIQEEVQSFVDTAHGFTGGVAGTYRIGVTPTLGPYLLPQVLPDIHERFQALRLFVREGVPADLNHDLRSAKHDLILSTQPIAEAGLEISPLFREPLKLVIPLDHRLANKKVINRVDLVGEEVLTLDEHHLYHRQVTELCQTLGATTRRDFEGTSLDTLRQMVVMGMGITFLPSLYVASEIRETDPLRVTDVSGVNMYRDHALAWRTRSPARPLFRRLAQTIRELLPNTGATELRVLY
jgi:LysR family hydrogen peroxide-inducible transcriptional activator